MSSEAVLKLQLRSSNWVRHPFRHSKTQPETEAEGKGAPMMVRGWPGKAGAGQGRGETPVCIVGCIICSCNPSC